MEAATQQVNITNTTKEEAKANLIESLQKVKFGVLDNVIRETADFLAFFNETAEKLSNCDFQCLANCTATDPGLLIAAKVNCLDRCGCFLPKAKPATGVEDNNNNDNGEDLPMSNVTLLKIAEKL